MDLHTKIVKEIIRLRESLNLDIEEFSKLCYISPYELQRIEEGINSPNFALLDKIAKGTNKEIIFKIE